MIALLANPLARTVLLVLVASGLSLSAGIKCTTDKYQLKIKNIKLEQSNLEERANAIAQTAIAENAKKNEEISRGYQTTIADLSDRYAAARVRIQAANRASLPKVDATPSLDGAAESNRLPAGMGTLELFEQCDLNTQQLLGLQAWHSAQ